MSSALVISTLLVGQAIFAAPFSYEYNATISNILGTISNINGAGLSVAQSAKITVTLDNGGTTRNSQTWTSAHLKAVTFNFNNGTVITIFYTPFGGSLDRTAGSFVTDGSGNLTSVMTNWADDGSLAVGINPGSLGTHFATNSAGTLSAWYLNGIDAVYGENNWTVEVRLTSIANMLTASNWATSTLVPAIYAVPTGLTAAVASATQINLSWTDNSSDETGFKIFKDGTLLYTTAANATSYNVTGLTCNTAYTFTVKAATNALGDSTAAATTPATTTTSSCSSAVSAPIFDLKPAQVFATEIEK